MHKPPTKNYLRYYFGFDILSGKTIVTTSSKKLSEFLDISRATVSRNLSKQSYYTSLKYIIGVSTSLERQDKGNYKQFKDDTSLMRESRQLLRDASKRIKDE